MKFKSLVLAVAAMVAPAASAQVGTFSIADVEGAQNSVVEVAIDMNNCAMDVIAFQCDIILPDGVEVVTDNEGPALRLSQRANRTFHSMQSLVRDNVVRNVVYSDRNASLKGSEGTILTFPVRLTGDAGQYEIQIDNVLVTDSGRKEHRYNGGSATVTISGTTGIDGIAADANDGSCYDIQGRVAKNPLPGGVYIQNGTKVKK